VCAAFSSVDHHRRGTTPRVETCGAAGAGSPVCLSRWWVPGRLGPSRNGPHSGSWGQRESRCPGTVPGLSIGIIPPSFSVQGDIRRWFSRPSPAACVAPAAVEEVSAPEEPAHAPEHQEPIQRNGLVKRSSGEATARASRTPLAAKMTAAGQRNPRIRCDPSHPLSCPPARWSPQPLPE